MVKKIDSLVSDIYALFGSGKEVNPEALKRFGEAMAAHVAAALMPREKRNALRGSMMGEKCDRKMYYAVNNPDASEDVASHTKLKFLYGHLLEEMLLFLAEEADHKVELRQHTVDIQDIEGHLDAVIDGVVVDVKSANSRGMDKFKYHKLETEDPFGYLDQIRFYYHGVKDHESVTDTSRVSFLAVDKELGHLVLDSYPATPRGDGADERAVRDRAEALKEMVKLPQPPQRGYVPVPDGKSGNMVLGVECRYCSFKKTCYPNLRTFIYSSGPRFLTTVAKVPDVPEEK